MKRLCLMLMTFLLISIHAFAEEKSDVIFRMYDGDIPTATITGAVSGDRRGYCQITYEVLRCDDLNGSMMETYEDAKKKLSEKNENDDFSDIVLHYNTVMTDNDGNYSFTYNQEKISGVYAIKIYKEYDEDWEYYLYTYTDSDELKEIMDRINKADKTSLNKIITENAYKLNVGTEEYEKLSADSVCEILISLRGEKFLDASDFADKYELAILLETLNEATDQTVVENVLVKNDDIFLLSKTDFYPTFSLQSTTIQKLVYDSLTKKNDYMKITDVQNAFCEKGFLTVNKNTSYWTDMRQFITGNAEWIGLDLTNYKNTKADNADKALVKKDFSSLEAWTKAFYTSLTESNTTAGSGSSGSSGKSSGVGSIQSVSVSTDVFEKEETKIWEVMFSDMENYSWAAEAVACLAKAEIVNGYSDGSFRPEGLVTRGEFAKMVACAFGLTKNGARCDFLDVPNDGWQYPYVSGLYRAGVVTGRDENIFGTEENITREEIAGILNRAADVKKKTLPLLNEKQVFSDADEISSYAASAVSSMQQAGVLKGNDDGTFNPRKCATRAEAAVMIYRLWNIMDGGEENQ